MNFPNDVQVMDEQLVKTFGESCQYRIKATSTDLDLMAVVEYELQFYPQYTDVVAGGVVITLRCADVARPQKGDRLTDSNGKMWKILKPLENDGSIVLVAATVDHRSADMT